MFEPKHKIAEWIAEYVKQNRPDYEIQCLQTTQYIKVSIMSTNFDYCIARVGSTTETRWFSLNVTPEYDKNDPLFAKVENKNKNHWVIPIKGIEDLEPYKKYFLITADDLYKTYEIDKYPYTGGSGIFSSDGIGIKISVPTK